MASILKYLILLVTVSSSLPYRQLPIYEVITPSSRQLQNEYGDALEAIFGIGVRLQALLEDPEVPSKENFLISPLSIALIIGQLMVGAEGRFREELYNLLSLPEPDPHVSSVRYYGKNKNQTYYLPYSKLHLELGALTRALEGKEISKAFTLSTANALFVNSLLRLKPEFQHNLGIYDTMIKPLNFTTDPVGSQRAINAWATAQTNGIIKTVLPAPLPTTATAIFANAIYFSADWETPFSYEANFKGEFHSTQKTPVMVEYMRGFFEDIPYVESAKLGCKMMAFPYKNREVAMYFILPNANDSDAFNIRKFANRLEAKDVLELITQMKNHAVSLQMPKMRLSNSLSVLKPLQKYHVFINQNEIANKTVSDPLDVLHDKVEQFEMFNTSVEADIYLTDAAVGQNLKITNIMQQMTLSVDEKGTEAAAVTLSITDYIGGNKMLKLDRPFVFFIRHEITSAVLFWGTIVDPTRSQ